MARPKAPGTVAESGPALQDRLAEARKRTDALFSLLAPGALLDRPVPERHRLVFYLGHLEAFDWNLIARRGAELPSFHPRFDQLFAFGIDPTGGGLPSEPASAWPPVEEIEDYNRRVRRTVDGLVRDSDAADPSRPLFHGGIAAQVAIEHRLMHAETLAYLIHQLPYDRKAAPPQADPPPGRTRLGRAHVPAGRATLGLPREEGRFGWDNEFEAHEAQVPAFTIDRADVTNGEYLEFVRAGGYREASLWSPPDRAWLAERRIEHPTFWRRAGDGSWCWRGIFAERPLPLDWPVFVSHAEASAFARWKGMALPTEAQFHRAAYGTPAGDEHPWPWGEVPPDPSRGNFDFARWDPAPVGAHPAGDSAFGVADLVGNGWEWTATPFAPFAGFEAFSFYPGYSAGFFDGRHFVMKGGSQRTAAAMLRRSFRNWFQPHYPHAYATFRCVSS